jgi:hypothetical protein
MLKPSFLIKILGSELYQDYQKLKQKTTDLATTKQKKLANKESQKVVNSGDLVLELITTLPFIKTSLEFVKNLKIPNGFNPQDINIDYSISDFGIEALEEDFYFLGKANYYKVCTIGSCVSSIKTYEAEDINI